MEEELILQQFATALKNVDDDVKDLEEEYDQTNEALLALIATLAGAYAWSKDNLIPYGKIDLIELEKQLYQKFGQLASIESTTYKDALSKIAQESHARNTYALQLATDIATNFNPMSKQKENAIVNKPYKGLTMTERAGVNHAKLIRTVKAEIVDGMMTGRDVGVIAKNVTKRVNVAKYETRRLLETEAVRIWTESQMEAWKESGLVEKVRFIATIDSRTSDECKDRHKKVYVLATLTKYPPLHPFCRSVLVPVFEDLDKLREQHSEQKTKPQKTFSAWQKAQKS